MDNYFNIEIKEIKTIAENIDNIVELTSEQKDKFDSFYLKFSKQSERKQLKLVYRGENENNLVYKLINSSSYFSKYKLFARIFYFGDKAKYFINKSKLSESKILFKGINDISEKVFEFIYKEIQSVLISQNNYVNYFCTQNQDFCEYFINDNSDRFISSNKAIRNFSIIRVCE